MYATSAQPKVEMLHIADTVARDKGINREDVLVAMEQAIQKAGRTKYGPEHDIRAEIDRRTGAIQLRRFREVVEAVEDEAKHLTVKEAQRYKKDPAVGDFIIDSLPPLDFGRIAAQTAKQVIVQKVREAEREKYFNEFKDRVGEVVTGVIKRVEFGNLTVDLGIAEGYLRRDELIPREVYRQNDRVRAYIFEVRKDGRGPQIMLSRTHPQFMAKLFAQEVPEIYEGIIQIRSVARDPGSRAKICVYTEDGSIDPVGSCVGMRGSRVQAVVSELQGEKVDIIPWSDDLATLVVRALQPAEVIKVVLDEENNRIEAVVPDDQLSRAIGRGGQNVRLASMMLGLQMDIITESEDSERRMDEFKQRSEQFRTGLDVDDVIAHLLVAEGFVSIEDIAQTPVEELMEIEGFDESIAQELINRAITHLEAEQQHYEEQQAALGFDDSLVLEAGLSPRMAVVVAQKGIKSLDDLADLATDELCELVAPERLSKQEAEQVIMAARAHWFADEQQEQAQATGTEA
jgi:transcription termination/antitermination protein NusA